MYIIANIGFAFVFQADLSLSSLLSLTCENALLLSYTSERWHERKPPPHSYLPSGTKNLIILALEYVWQALQMVRVLVPYGQSSE